MIKNSSSSCGRINKAKPYREDEWGTLTYDVDDIIAERESIAEELERIYTMLYEEGFGRHNEIMELAKELTEDE